MPPFINNDILAYAAFLHLPLFLLRSDYKTVLAALKKSFLSDERALISLADLFGKAVGPFGCVGAFIQPQGQLTLLTNTIDFHMNPQAAIDSPRWFWEQGKTIAVEKDLPEHIYDQLCRMGHNLVRGNYKPNMGRAQIIWRDPETGVLNGACDKRCDGTPMAY